MLVGEIVARDKVDVQVLRDRLLDLAQEAQKILVAMARLALGNHLAGRHVQRREQDCGAEADVLVGDAPDINQTHGQQWMRPVRSLNLRLLDNAENHCLVGWVEVQADDVPDLFHEKRIGREPEMLLAERLNREGLQPTVNGRLGDPCSCSQSPGIVVGAAIGRSGLQCPVDHLGDGLVLVGAWAARPQRREAPPAPVPVALAPLTDGHPHQPHPLGDGGVGFAGTAGQNDLDPLNNGMGKRA